MASRVVLSVQCFDLTTFLRFNEKCLPSGWKCPVCHTPMNLADLQVRYLENLRSMSCMAGPSH
jgi:hypothetical protein